MGQNFKTKQTDYNTTLRDATVRDIADLLIGRGIAEFRSVAVQVLCEFIHRTKRGSHTQIVLSEALYTIQRFGEAVYNDKDRK